MQRVLTFLLLFYMFINSVFAEGWEKTTLESNFIACVEHAPFGILAGELDGRIWLNPKNAVYLSKNLGETWEEVGLEERGIKDLKYYNGKIYAATYYFQDGIRGIFVSEDLGKNWTHIGPGYAPTKIDRDKSTLYFGTEHYGLWVSFDEGSDWHQKLGDGGDGTTIKTLKVSENIALVSSTNGVFKSLNNGQTWEEVSFLNDKDIAYFLIEDGLALAAASYNKGLYKSNNSGTTWEKVESFGNLPIGAITKFKNWYYVGKQTPDYLFSVYKTSNFLNWEDTHLDVGQVNKVTDTDWVFSDPSLIFAAVTNRGLYKYEVPKYVIPSFSFLSTPWKPYNNNELIDRITAFFDHKYPLLGYSYYTEPAEENDTTLNFLGEKDSEPNIYYSSHSGTDYSLGYGTEITAPASGNATYYTCPACGHSIKIDHLNGYQTTYMHLQSEGLITRGGPIWVNAEDTIGKVGMTGNTSGPHLHFEVSKGTFPDGRTDPYGWVPEDTTDPWAIFSWNDALGGHQGSESIYLWEEALPQISNFLSSEETFTLENIQVSLNEPGSTFFLKRFSRPLLHSQANLKYLSNTSFTMELFNQTKNKIENLKNAVEFVVDFSQSDFSNLVLETIKLYFWNKYSKLWEPLPTILDLTSFILTAYSDHLSYFAILGEKLKKEGPETQILVSGSQSNSWFYEFPLISFYSNDDQNSNIDTTFYSISNNDTWEVYDEPLLIQKNGFVNIKFRSTDKNGNLEETKTQLVKINTDGKWVDKNRIKNSFFRISF